MEETKAAAIKDLLEWMEIAKEDETAANQYVQGFAHGMEYIIEMILLTHYDYKK